MAAPTSEWIPVEKGIIDTQYCGYKTSDRPNALVFGSVVYKGNGIGWAWGKEDRIIKNIIELNRELNYKEVKQWYLDHYNLDDPKVSNNLYGLFHDLYNVGDARHEMFNAWIGTDWYEMSGQLDDEDFYLVGIAPAPFGTSSIKKPIAFVAETYDGTDRFWCHGDESWVESMREQMRDIYNSLAK